jgi:DNA-binding SARP family transcriptional activator/TolB-like protein/Tfp pilus assembly protein PilF
MIVLRLLGEVSVEVESRPLSGRAAQRHRIALLALLASQPRGFSRDRLLLHLWPDSDAQHARNLLSQALNALRGALGPDAILAERDQLRLNPDRVSADLWSFRAACAAAQWQTAVRLYAGPFLDGFFLSGSVEFERWTDEQRLQLGGLYTTALQGLAEACAAAGDQAGAVVAWRRLAAHEPLNCHVALRLMNALAEAGDRAGAIRHAAVYGALLREEIGADAEPEVAALVEQLRSEPHTRRPAVPDRTAPGPGDTQGRAAADAVRDAGAGASMPAAASYGVAGDAAGDAAGGVAGGVADGMAGGVAGGVADGMAGGLAGGLADGAAGGAAGDVAGGGDRRAAPEAVWWRGRNARVAAIALMFVLGGVLAVASRERLGSGAASDPTAPTAPTDVAVLPFHILSDGAADMFLAVGLADAVITRLSALPGIRVRPTSAILRFERDGTDLRAAGRTLEVEHLLTGTVQRTAGGIRASIQLVKVHELTPIWAHEFLLAEAALSALPDSVAARAAIALRGGGSVVPPAGPAVAATTYEQYLRARSSLVRQRESDVRSAIADFEAVIAADPGFAPAHAGLARASAELHLRFAGREEMTVWGQRAVDAARRALELDHRLAEGYEALAAVHRKTEFDWDATIDASRRALALNPSAALPHFYIGSALYHLGLLPEAERWVRRGLEVQPVTDRAEALRTLGTVALAAGRFAEAVTLLQDVQRLSDRPVSDPHLATAYFYLGEHDQAEQILIELLQSGSASAAARARATLGSILAAAGRRQEAATLLAQAERGATDHHVSYSIGATHAQLGDTAEAIRWLRLAADTGFRCYPWYRRDPLLDPLRRRPEFQAFLAELRRGWERDRSRYRM